MSYQRDEDGFGASFFEGWRAAWRTIGCILGFALPIVVVLAAGFIMLMWVRP